MIGDIDPVLREDINILARLTIKLATAAPERKAYQRQVLLKHLLALGDRWGREEAEKIANDCLEAVKELVEPAKRGEE